MNSEAHYNGQEEGERDLKIKIDGFRAGELKPTASRVVRTLDEAYTDEHLGRMIRELLRSQALTTKKEGHKSDFIIVRRIES